MEKKLCTTKWWSKNDHLRKILLAMKLTIFIVLLTLGSLKAENSYSQTTRLNINLKDVPIKEVLKSIEDKSEFFFLFNSKIVDVERNVTIVAKNQRIDKILKRLFQQTDVVYKVIDRQIILTNKAYFESLNILTNERKQQLIVTGTVKDSMDNQPLPGVNILIQGITDGTITDLDGEFSIEVPDANATLIFSYVGYTSKTISLNGRTSLDVQLVATEEGIEEVLVTALGIKREERALGYAVQKVAGDELTTVKGIDVGTSLTGKVAGLLVKNSTEFAAEPSLLIRGEEPLLVVDGVPYGNMSLRDIPSDDIENISVLKGATASALYGFRGASGAIMVTTISGSTKKGLSVTINSSTLFAAGYLAIPEMQSTYGRVVNTSTNTYVQSGNGAWGPPLEGQEVIQWDPISKTMIAMPYLPVGKDNFKNYLEQGFVLNNNINVIQQGEFGSLRTSATWVQNKGQYPNSVFNKLTYSVGGDMKINKFSLSSNITYNKNVSPNTGFNGYRGYDPMYSLLIWSAPDWNILDYKDYWLVPNEIQNNSYTSGNNNPYFDRYERIHSVNKDIFNGNITMNYEFTPWLKATFRTGYDTYSNSQEIRVSKGSFQGAGATTLITNGTQVWGESQKGSYNQGIGRGYSLNNDLLLSANQKFGDFAIDGFIGGSVYYNQDEGIETRTRGGLSVPAFYSLKASVDPVITGSNIYKRQVNSLFSRVGVSWKNIAFLEGTLRNDWVSTLPESTRSYAYPSVSGSFIVSELFQKMDWLSLWKLRGSWVTVKTPASIYEINSVFSITNNAWGTLSSASFPTTIRGTDVLPQSASTYEVGTVINLYKNRASLDVAYYSKRMFDFLKKAGISPASGYSSNYLNTDEEITREGVEISANVTPIKTTDWQWDISLNWSKYARYYTQIDTTYTSSYGFPWVKVGERADAYVLRDYLRDPEGNIIHNASGLPQYSAYNSKFGNSDPDWIWGANTTLRYKNFTFTLSVDGRVGGLAQTTTEMYMWRSGNHPNSLTPERYLDATEGTSNYIGKGVVVVSGTVEYDTYGNITSDSRVFAPNDIATTYKSYIEKLHKGTAWGGSPSPLDTYSTSFFKIREISLTYMLPKSISSKIRATDISISAVGQNVLLWAKQFKYSDPDGGSENFSDPSLRYLGFNLKASF